MKRRYVTIVLLACTALFTACSKDYTCTCVIDYNLNKPTAYSDTVAINYSNVTKHLSRKQCGSEATNYNNAYDTSYMHDCAL